MTLSSASSPPLPHPAGESWSEIGGGTTLAGDWKVFATAATEGGRCFGVETEGEKSLGTASDRYQGLLPACGMPPSSDLAVQFLNFTQIKPQTQLGVTLYLLSPDVISVVNGSPNLEVRTDLDHQVVIVAASQETDPLRLSVATPAGTLHCEADTGPLAELRCT